MTLKRSLMLCNNLNLLLHLPWFLKVNWLIKVFKILHFHTRIMRPPVLAACSIFQVVLLMSLCLLKMTVFWVICWMHMAALVMAILNLVTTIMTLALAQWESSCWNHFWHLAQW